MDEWKKDARRDVVFVDIDALVPQDHLLRKIEKVMDYDWLYERLDPYYCHDNGRPGTDPVVLIKMVLIQHLYGIRISGDRGDDLRQLEHPGDDRSVPDLRTREGGRAAAVHRDEAAGKLYGSVQYAAVYPDDASSDLFLKAEPPACGKRTALGSE